MRIQATLHQGAIESIFLDSMKDLGKSVNRLLVPVSLALDEDKALVRDPGAHAVKVRFGFGGDVQYY